MRRALRAGLATRSERAREHFARQLNVVVTFPDEPDRSDLTFGGDSIAGELVHEPHIGENACVAVRSTTAASVLECSRR